MTTQEVLLHLARRLPGYQLRGDPQPLGGGYLNYVWRVSASPGPLIVKLVPPFVSSIPAMALDAKRARIEARALQSFEPGGPLADLAKGSVRTPRLLDFDELRNILIMEDVCNCPDLGTWLREQSGSQLEARQAGAGVGGFIGALHKRSFGDERLRAAFDNRGIQKVRLEHHYRMIGGLCRKAGLADAESLGERAAQLGERLQAPGACLIMGDLWPASIIVAPENLRIIDWELSHFGWPCQDVAHLAAHLWMHAHRAPDAAAAERARACLQGFLEAYAAAGDIHSLLGAEGLRQCAIHFGTEILVRTIGNFQGGYLYNGLLPADPRVWEAVRVAAEHIRHPDQAATFAPLSAGAQPVCSTEKASR